MSAAPNPVHGNYYGYYSKRPAANRDPRLSLLPPETLKGKRVLDIGCNEGWITCEIALSYGATEIVGVDIDDALVRSAWKRRRSVWSQHAADSAFAQKRQLPPNGLRSLSSTNEDASSSERDSNLHLALRKHNEAFPSAFEHMFGPLPIPPSDISKARGSEPSLGLQTDLARDASASESASDNEYSDEEWYGFEASYSLVAEDEEILGSDTASEFDLVIGKKKKTREESEARHSGPITNGAPRPSVARSMAPHFDSIPQDSAESVEGARALRSVGVNTFPHNVVFRKGDWARDGIIDDREGWDVLLALSVTKWIHLNEGDEGIRALFRRAFDTLRTGGVFIVEPQEWDTYAKARRMDQRLRENAKRLRLRPADFERVLLQEIGFRSVEHLGYAGKGGFSRPLDLYRK